MIWQFFKIISAIDMGMHDMQKGKKDKNKQ